jgi:hypothetical protein
MAVVEENRKSFPLALTYRKEAETWKDSLNNQNKVWAIAELKRSLQLRRNKRSVLEAENKVKMKETVCFFFSFLLMLFNGTYFYRQK